ncbi:uncharacterized protein C4orf51 homolog isoform X2 [Octodon degus]|uniref:Uncharacterized protein C4orf51 homolog isoform X2 n=1 Tax=Octodon degus TaxID=10160 RepID=A0A6P6DNA2_OCTDE|nr:uncharacterized protein C4orf51 homolog isoform X2 [Octodon degus]
MSQFLFLTPQILLPFSPLTSQEFDLIRHKARASWQNETRWCDSSVTTYSGSYREKQLDESTHSRLAFRTAGQQELVHKRTWLPNSSTHNPPLSGADTQETKDVKGRFPDITGSLKTPLEIKHRVVHQTWYSADAPPVRPKDRKSCVKSKQPALEMRMNLKCMGRIFSKQIQP